MQGIDATVGREEFLRLFTTQLRFQDPLNPLKSTEFTTQLAQFSSLEQLINMNDNLESILTYQNSLNNALATGLIGREVTTDGNTVELISGEPVTINYELPSAVETLTLNIYDSTGNRVKTVSIGASDPGSKSFLWDGTDNNGNALPEGTYTVEFEGTDKDGNPVSVTTETYSRVTGITFENGVTYLVLENGQRVSLGEIKEIREGGV
ncbi:MAG: flagellar hook capping protein [Nitrospirae bacterium]|nr:MAG: flagellar hook capping protein [Nitrospirota bacterium]